MGKFSVNALRSVVIFRCTVSFMFQSDGKSRTADCQVQPLSQYGFISLLVEPITCSFLSSVRASVLFFQRFDNTGWEMRKASGV